MSDDIGRGVRTSPARSSTIEGFTHEALFYDGENELLDGAGTFVREGMAAGEPVLVVMAGDRIEALRRTLNGTPPGVRFVDMGEVGRNPARIIPAWRDFLDEHGNGGRPVRGIGEPAWPGRSRDELVECRHHEALLNVAFAEVAGFRLLCPYAASELGHEVVAGVYTTHPLVIRGGLRGPSPAYQGVDTDCLLGEPLPPPPPTPHRLVFRSVRSVRKLVLEQATVAGLDRQEIEDAVLAVNEIAANSLRHGGGIGTLLVWSEAGFLVCQVDDDGWITDPLAGREDPGSQRGDGRGLWLVHRLCDLVQIRTSPEGTTARLHFRMPVR